MVGESAMVRAVGCKVVFTSPHLCAAGSHLFRNGKKGLVTL